MQSTLILDPLKQTLPMGQVLTHKKWNKVNKMSVSESVLGDLEPGVPHCIHSTSPMHTYLPWCFVAITQKASASIVSLSEQMEQQCH